VQGKPVVNSISLKEGRSEFLRQARLARRYGAAVSSWPSTKHGQAETVARKVAIAHRAYNIADVNEVGFARRTSSSTPTSSPSPRASRSTTSTPWPFSKLRASRPSCPAR
jgi:hypothetical protein